MNNRLYNDPDELRDLLVELRKARESRKRESGRRPRIRLSESERRAVLESTAGRCHICGGRVGAGWQADHVLAHSGGGSNSHENFLPAHALCNNYRWDYLPEEFQLILKIGVFARSEIEKNSPLGREIAKRFAKKESGIGLRRVVREED